MKFSDLPLHHAVLVTHPNRVLYGHGLWEELQKISVAHRYFNQTVLDIGTAREIISFAQTPYNEDKVALISFNTASLPAQNAMLKVLEEPRAGVRFILLTTHKNTLIETVLSRVQHVQVEGVIDVQEKHAEEFLATSPSFRIKLSFVTTLLAGVDEEGRKDRESVKMFILSLVEVLAKNHVEARYITETLEIASYASDPSASGKALIEYLALLLPQTR